MNKRRKRRLRAAERRIAHATRIAAVPPGLPGGPPYTPQISSPVSAVLQRRRPSGLYLPERLARAADRENPISQYIRALDYHRWGLPIKPQEDQ